MAHDAFVLKPIPPFRLDLTVWTLRRRAHNGVDRWDGETYRRVLAVPGGPVEVAVAQIAPPQAPRLQVVVTGRTLRAEARAAVTAALERLLGLRIDLKEFYRFAAHDRRLRGLAQRFRGMKPPRFTTAFEGAVNALACQQLTLTVGIYLLNRLAAAYGAPFGKGDAAVHAFPLAEDLAGLKPAELRPFGFSRQKGQAIIALSQAIATGRLDLEGLAALPDGQAVERLCELRGIGRWSAEYILLRGFGRTRIFPGDDVGARNKLQHWLRLTQALDYEKVRRIQSRWNGYAGLVYFHLLLKGLAEAGALN